MFAALCARMPCLGLAAGCSPSLARLPVVLLLLLPVRLPVASLGGSLSPALSWPSLLRWLGTRGVLCKSLWPLLVAERQRLFGCFVAAQGAPPRSSFSAAGGARSAP